MKDNKVTQLRRGAIALRQQFAQSCDGVFSDVLGEAEIATVPKGVRPLFRFSAFGVLVFAVFGRAP